MDPSLLIGDIVERDSSQKKPVQFPTAPPTSTGYPEHKKRWKPSAFKQRRAGAQAENVATPNEIVSLSAPKPTSRSTAPSSQGQQAFEQMDRQRIDNENRQKLDSMSPEEISRAQQELLSGLDPSIVQRLLARANLDEPSEPSPFDPPPVAAPVEAESAAQPTPPPPPVRVEDVPDDDDNTRTEIPTDDVTASTKKVTFNIPDNYDEDKEPSQVPSDLFPLSDLQKESTHFPSAPSVPDLDPSDPDFLSNLHEKYFANLPADPSKLAWMAPIPTEGSVADKESTYYPHPEIAVSALRFDFRGRFLSPRVSRTISSSKGLHHHGQAPEAAGYTIEELSILARSAVPAQRCMAFQTLGRILYRLGNGEWGKTDNHPIAMGVWNAIKKGRVLQTLEAAAAIEGGHRGSQVYATEALWLFEKGGWKEKVQGR